MIRSTVVCDNEKAKNASGGEGLRGFVSSPKE